MCSVKMHACEAVYDLNRGRASEGLTCLKIKLSQAVRDFDAHCM